MTTNKEIFFFLYNERILNTIPSMFGSEATVAANALGVDEDLIRRMFVILCTLSSTQEIDPEKLQEYCWSTAELFVRLYPWYHMPQALHKVLIHSHQVVRAKPLPIGMLSEEAQEASNKNVKRFRENFTRKTSRKDTNCDLMRRMLCSSDPVISSLRRSADNKKELELPEEAAELLV